MSALELFGALLRRLGWFVVTFWAVFTLSFFLMRLSPGGPFMGEKKLPEEIRRNLDEFYNLNAPLHEQYLTTLGNVVLLNLGPSQKLKDYTVNEVIAEGFPVSMSLGVIALTLALIGGTIAGVVSAVKRNTIYDFGFMGLATLGIAIPNFVLASLAIIIFCFYLPILPAAGWGSPQQIILPAICLAAPYAAYIARLTRAGMLEVLNLDYVRTAYAKGLQPRTVIVKHALRGAILPVVSFIGPAAAGILTGSLVIERIFNVPGFGSHFIDAALQRDYPLAMGAVLVYTALLYVMNSLVDLSYSVIDPRVKLE
ncbi:Dipeptide transport system permease protein DppB [Anatilimnocola aggregata]|uniref:Dipeptide transport system permease protein DppB n=1 Tax=Anatilimnocola aggregata TaxID=2528021 RepID=A0A517Y9G7_9BACT|nr:ABC transporter permease subunit [Anatilimnocola aggregata]QDU26877.1 Dipeptide transport system permease protein DppB [Anatilimnocola aggregata]